MDSLLTIAIPTYNRARFLDRCLESIYRQISGMNGLVNVLVSDNCSSDNTKEIVDKYIALGLPLAYHLNEVNRGADFNIAQCYLKATGKYAVAFGDDDIWADHSIAYVCEILKTEEFGTIFLEPVFFKQDHRKEVPVKAMSVRSYSSAEKYLTRINCLLTFISSNVIHRDYIKATAFETYYNTSMVQVPAILSAALGNRRKGYVSGNLIAAQADNTGGYKLFEVFGNNFTRILKEYAEKYNNGKIYRIVTNEMQLDFFPYWILNIRGKRSSSDFRNEPDGFDIVTNAFGSTFLYRLVVKPVMKLPLVLAGKYFLLVRVVNKLRKINR